MYLFAKNLYGDAKIFDYFNLKVFALKMYKGDTLIRDFVPCYRKFDKVAGLYDLVEGKFYTNANVTQPRKA